MESAAIEKLQGILKKFVLTVLDYEYAYIFWLSEYETLGYISEAFDLIWGV